MIYLCIMKLTLKIKLLPSEEQAQKLLDTIKEVNTACNEISDVAWEKKTFNTFKLHNLTYYHIKSVFGLSSQLIVRAISKVSASYKLNKKCKQVFRLNGSIAYDSRILSYSKDFISISTIKGRIKIHFICHRPDWLPYIKGEADLIARKGKYFLFQCVEFPDEKVKNVEEFIGCDFGLVDICTLNNGKSFNSKSLQNYREKRQKIRSSLQSKGTKNAKRVLKRLSGKERTHGTIINHTISKQIIQFAKIENKGIAIEDLKGIRFSSLKKGKKFRSKVGKWSFYQLRQFLTYKSLLNGIPLVIVNPRYTSQMCNECKCIGTRQGKIFQCTNKNCKIDTLDADYNAAKNISLLGRSINNAENSTMYCSLHS